MYTFKTYSSLSNKRAARSYLEKAKVTNFSKAFFKDVSHKTLPFARNMIALVTFMLI